MPSAPHDGVAILLGVPVDDVTRTEAVEQIGTMVEAGRSSGRTHQVATVNVDFVVNTVGDAPLLRIMQRTDLAVPDGMPLVWGSRVVGAPLRERTAGADLVPALVASAEQRGHRFCLFGGPPGVAQQAASSLRRDHPHVQIVGLEAPAVDADGSMDPQLLRAIIEFDPDVVCVALGNPKQERWIERYRRAVGAPVFIGIGGSLDFLTGVTRRAPAWMQRAGLEWLHRAVSEPRRLAGRYAKDLVVFGPRLLRQLVVGRRRRRLQDPVLDIELAADGRAVVVDCGAVRLFDNRTAASLCAAIRAARRQGRAAIVIGVDGQARRSARRLGIEGLLDRSE